MYPLFAVDKFGKRNHSISNYLIIFNVKASNIVSKYVSSFKNGYLLNIKTLKKYVHLE